MYMSSGLKVANEGYTGAQWTLCSLSMNVNLSTISVTVAYCDSNGDRQRAQVVWKGDC